MSERELLKVSDGDSVLVNHPQFGSLWLEKVSVDNGYVVGRTWDSSGSGWNMPEDYTGEWVTMNFPLSCVRKVEQSVGINREGEES